MVFTGGDQPFAGHFRKDQLLVERLDGEHIDHFHGYALALERLRRPQRVLQHRAHGNEQHVAALFQHVAAAERKAGAGRIDRQYALARGADVVHARTPGQRAQQPFQLHAVRRVVYLHAGDRPHEADVLKAGVRAAVRGGAYAGV